MEIKCTVKELKELLQKDTPVVATTDVLKINVDSKAFSERIISWVQAHNCPTANCDKPLKF